MNKLEYWQESVTSSAEEHGVQMTEEQAAAMAMDIMYAHENIGMVFHVPSGGGGECMRCRDLKEKISLMEREYDEYRGNAEAAVRKALGQDQGSMVVICEDAEVYRCDGRTTRIQ